MKNLNIKHSNDTYTHDNNEYRKSLICNCTLNSDEYV